MAKKSGEPWMPFYGNSWLIGCSELTDAQFRIYLEMCWAYWVNEGPIPADPRQLCNIIATDLRKIRTNWSQLCAKFVEKDGFLYHQRIDEELSYRTDSSNKARKSANARWHPEKEKDGCDRNARQTNKQTVLTKVSTYTLKSADLSFAKFYATYPKQTTKKEAKKYWHAQCRNGTYDDEKIRLIMADVNNRKQHHQGWRDKQFIPDPIRYLRNERWKDEIDERAGTNGSKNPYQESVDQQQTWFEDELRKSESSGSSMDADAGDVRDTLDEGT